MSSNEGITASNEVTLVWFRKSLRLHDNSALVEAASTSAHVVPVFILDPWFANPANVGALRFNFLLQALRDLDESLQRSYGTRLVVLRGEPVSTLSSIFQSSPSSASSQPSQPQAKQQQQEICEQTLSISAASLLKCDHIVWEEEAVEPYGMRRDAGVLEAAKACGVSARAIPGGHHLWNPEEALGVALKGGSAKKKKGPPTTMKGFESLVSQLGPVPPPLEPPPSLPPLPQDLNLLLSGASSDALPTSLSSIDPRELLPPLCLTELPGFAADPTALRIAESPSSSSSSSSSSSTGPQPFAPYGLVGGESAGLARLRAVVEDPARTAWVTSFEKPKTRSTGFDDEEGSRGIAAAATPPEAAAAAAAPEALIGGGLGRGGNGGPSTTLLSPYLKFGCVSARRVHQALERAEERQRSSGGSSSSPTSPPTSLRGQLYFRELAYLNAKHFGESFGRAPSPVCADIPWLPTTTAAAAGNTPSSKAEDSSVAGGGSSGGGNSGGGGFGADTAEGDRRLAAWEAGQTGFPYIDACMRQLSETGWLHHLARHAVACFLTRGDLWVSWERGRDVFDKHLLDADWAVNNFNWLWLAGVAPWSSPYFRVYSPIPDPKASSLNVLDPEGLFVKRFVPELRLMPAQYVYEPWKAPPAVQARAKCLVGDTKPPPTSAAEFFKARGAKAAHRVKEEEEEGGDTPGGGCRRYPAPLVDHKEASKANIAKFKAALEANRARSPGKPQEEGSGTSSDERGGKGPARKKAKK